MGLADQLLNHLTETTTPPSDDQLKAWIEENCWIVPKGEGAARRPIRLVLNPAQQHYWAQHTARDYIVKFRQGGFSTLILAEAFARAVLLPNQNVLILAHRKESTVVLFDIIRQFYERLPASEKKRLNGAHGEPRTHNTTALEFAANGSRIAAQTAGSKSGARGRTLTFCHLSETAYYGEWAGDVISSIEGALTAGGIIRLETTPNIAGTWAYQTWQSCLTNEKPQYTPVFLPWWLHAEYQGDPAEGGLPYSEEEAQGITQHQWTPEQIAWRRRTMQNLDNPAIFRTEYPEDPLSGWLRTGRTVFHVPYILRAYGNLPPSTPDNQPGWREYVKPEPGETYWMGVDPAEGVQGGDFSALQVFNRHGEQCAEWADYLPIHQLAALIRQSPYPLSKLVVERNNHGHALIEHLQGLPMQVDKDKRFGLVASRQSKAQWIARATHGFWQNFFTLHSYRLFQQLTQYVYNDADQAGGPDHGGDRILAHDDLISAFLLAVWELVDPRDHTQQPMDLHETTLLRKPSPVKRAQRGDVYPWAEDKPLMGQFQTPLQLPTYCPGCYRPLSGKGYHTVSYDTLMDGSACPSCGQATQLN